MEENNEHKLKDLVNNIDKEFQGLNYYQRAKFALDQISTWQQKFNEAKIRIQREDIVVITPASEILSQYPEIEA